MKNLAWIPASMVVTSLVYVAACSSTSSNGSNTGGGAGSIGGVGACVLFLDDGGNPSDAGTAASCLVTSVNGTNTSGPPCSTGLTYATSCPTQGLVGCCTNHANSNSTTVVLFDSCFYSDVGITASQEQEVCLQPYEDGGLPGTWSTSPPE